MMEAARGNCYARDDDDDDELLLLLLLLLLCDVVLFIQYVDVACCSCRCFCAFLCVVLLFCGVLLCVFSLFHMVRTA